MRDKKEVDALLGRLAEAETTQIHGRITEVIGMLMRARVPQATIGDVCLIKRKGEPLLAQVVGFTQDEAILSPLGEMAGVSAASPVIPLRKPLEVKVGMGMLGRVIDALGNPLDGKGPLDVSDTYPVLNAPPSAMTRKIIEEPIQLGVRAIDAVLTCGEGQRVGIFAAAGGGKSTLLGMIARGSPEDVINVIVLIGERGREVGEFLIDALGPEGVARSVVVVSTSDQAAQLRINAAYLGTAIAEYFRDNGHRVILMMDSVTRFARAIREVGLAAGEPPARAGYTPSVFATLPKLLERSGNSDKGSITAFYTILVAGDDMNEPVADETKSILDGHIVLSSKLAQQFHYPAIDVLASASRILNNITNKEHRTLIGKLRDVLAIYQKNELLINIGEYKRGTNTSIDNAIDKIDAVNSFLKQSIDDESSFEESLDGLRRLFR